MASPTVTTAVADLRPDLAGLMTEFDVAMDAENFIGTKVLPVIETKHQAGPFGKIKLEELLKNPVVTRGSFSGYNRRNWSFDDDSFATKEYGLEGVVDERNANIYAEYVDAEAMTGQLIRADILRAAELRAAALIFNASTWSPTAVTTEWSVAASCTPITDVEAKVRLIWAACGLWPNAIIMNRHVFRNLRNSAQIIDRIASSGAGSPTKPTDITTAMLSQCFDIPYIFVGGGTKNTAIEPQAAVLGKIWDDEYCWIGRVATTNSIEEPCVGRTFHWGADGSTIGATVESYDEIQSRGRVIRVRHEVQEKTIHTACGGLLSNITA